MFGDEGPHRGISEQPGIEGKGDAVRLGRSSQACVELLQGISETFQIGSVGCRGDVHVLGEKRRSSQSCRNPTDDQELRLDGR